VSAKKRPGGLRSVQWFGRQDIYGFIYRSWVKNRGIPQDQFDGPAGHRHLQHVLRADAVQ
jgi:hypothetical protein